MKYGVDEFTYTHIDIHGMYVGKVVFVFVVDVDVDGGKNAYVVYDAISNREFIQHIQHDFMMDSYH